MISALDLGASPRDLAWRIPEHVFKVIFSRFRGESWTLETCLASVYFACEFVCLLCLLPRWILRHSTGVRSTFWREQVGQGRGPAGYGLPKSDGAVGIAPMEANLLTFSGTEQQ